MQSTLKTFKIIGPVLILLASNFACGPSPVDCSAGVYEVKRITNSKPVDVSDHSLSEWNSSFMVMEITSRDRSPQSAFINQWKNIRGPAPSQLSAHDIELKVYMARDSSYWYIALDASDDKVLPSPSDDPPDYPYSGDCLEIFFAGTELDSSIDISRLKHAERQGSSNQAAFFQLELPSSELPDNKNYFAVDRTDSGFIDTCVSRGFQVAVWRTKTGWSAEARIPFGAFDDAVRSRINSGKPLKMNIDYLDYDNLLGVHTNAGSWGFTPDNVYCLDDQERHVNLPKYMRCVVFP